MDPDQLCTVFRGRGPKNNKNKKLNPKTTPPQKPTPKKPVGASGLRPFLPVLISYGVRKKATGKNSSV